MVIEPARRLKIARNLIGLCERDEIESEGELLGTLDLIEMCLESAQLSALDITPERDRFREVLRAYREVA